VPQKPTFERTGEYRDWAGPRRLIRLRSAAKVQARGGVQFVTKLPVGPAIIHGIAPQNQLEADQMAAERRHSGAVNTT
jgi:hypothetical protein